MSTSSPQLAYLTQLRFSYNTAVFGRFRGPLRDFQKYINLCVCTVFVFRNKCQQNDFDVTSDHTDAISE